MAVNSVLFIAIPFAALLLNLFLLLICISAKKNRLIYAFMLLVIAYSTWSGGSAAMRASLSPSVQFWFNVSITGIFFVPFLIYNFVHQYTGNRGSIILVTLGISWTALAVLSLNGAFIQTPSVILADGTHSFVYTVSNWVFLPFLLAIVTLVLSFRQIFSSIKYQGLPFNAFVPFFIGTAILFVGLATTSIPAFGSFPTDPLACGVNALFLFYALYKKRLITFKMVTSRGPMYMSAVIIMTSLMSVFYKSLEYIYDQWFPEYTSQKTIVFAVLLSIVTVLVYNIIRKLMYVLFNKSSATRDEELRLFSREINETLDSLQIMKTFCDLIERNLDCDAVYILIQEEDGSYSTKASTKPISSEGITIRKDSPLIEWLQNHNLSISYKDFTRTSNYLAMWSSEKEQLSANKIRLMLPITESGRLLAFAMFADQENRKNYTQNEVTFLESAGAVMSIAAKNAILYAAIHKETYIDALTGLYNRRFFMEQAKQQFEQARMHTFSIIMFSLDDFGLFNELYGSHQGDQALQAFSKILQAVAGNQNCIARYNANEFIVSLPFKDVPKANGIVDLVRVMLKDHIEKNREQGYRYLTFSAGICTYPVSSSSMEETVNYAGIALYTAKKNGKNRTQLYSSEPSSIAATPESVSFGKQCAQTIYALTAAIDVKDHYTYQHSQNVSLYASQLADNIGLDPEHVEIIRQAGLLHDVGKIGIPESILGKQGELTVEEYAIMRQHPESSVAMLKYLPSLDYVVPAVFSHHERWDGKGYPRGLEGEHIPITARCLCIADSFDAMTTVRSYKPALSVSEALDEIRRNLGTQFDPRIGLKFVKLIENNEIKLNKSQYNIVLNEIPDATVIQVTAEQFKTQ
jgi:diguanylate cyclase (GGDEF)-like protein/putative nucleotidyltransferase with HDIG domain